MTPVRTRRSKYTHVTLDLRTTVCGKRCDSWICGTDEWRNMLYSGEACPVCVERTTTN